MVAKALIIYSAEFVLKKIVIGIVPWLVVRLALGLLLGLVLVISGKGAPPLVSQPAS